MDEHVGSSHSHTHVIIAMENEILFLLNVVQEKYSNYYFGKLILFAFNFLQTLISICYAIRKHIWLYLIEEEIKSANWYWLMRKLLGKFNWNDFWWIIFMPSIKSFRAKAF